MARLDMVVDEKIDKRFRDAYKAYGLKGSIKMAAEDAIELWFKTKDRTQK